MSFSPPKKTKNIPDGAQWLGGIGAGSWFFLLKKSTYYQIKRFSAYGNLECKGLFVVDDNSFRIEESFEFTYLSHCSLCTVLQNDKKFKFSLHENQNV